MQMIQTREQINGFSNEVNLQLRGRQGSKGRMSSTSKKLRLKNTKSKTVKEHGRTGTKEQSDEAHDKHQQRVTRQR